MSYHKDDGLVDDEGNKVTGQKLQELLDFLEQEGVGEEFEEWMNDESEEAYELDFLTWLDRKNR